MNINHESVATRLMIDINQIEFWLTFDIKHQPDRVGFRLTFDIKYQPDTDLVDV